MNLKVIAQKLKCSLPTVQKHIFSNENIRDCPTLKECLGRNGRRIFTPLEIKYFNTKYGIEIEKD